MFLDNANRKLQVILAAAKSSVDCPVVVDWVDITASATTPGPTPTVTNGVTAVDIVPAPGGSTQRKVNGLSLVNVDTGAITPTIRLFDNSTLSTLFKATLQVGEALYYTDVEGFFVVDAAGGRKVAGRSGRYLKTTLVLNPTTAFVTGPETNTIFVRLQAAGGAGGGCTSVASAAGAAGGASGGGYAEKTFAVAPNTSYVCAVGLGGTGVSAAAGNPGGDTTFAVGGVTVTAKGGLGGPQCVPTTALKAFLGAAGPAVSTNGDLNDGGVAGGPGIILIVTGSVGVSGEGGASMLGNGALGVVAAGNGTNATVGYGGGGSGGLTAASAARAGGNGAAGVISVDEFA
jgi:hypothetical protein